MTEDQIVEIAKVELSRAGESRRTMLEEHTASFRWLMASFLAINGGGLLTLKDFHLSGTEQGLAAIFFYIGIVSALAIAWLGQRANRTALPIISELEAFWAGVSVTGEFDEELYAMRLKAAHVASAQGRSRWAGWVSLVAFSLGMGTIGVGSILTPPSPPTPPVLVQHK